MGPHLVKEAVLTDELLPGLGVDGDGEPHVCHQELVQRQGQTSEVARAGAPDPVCTSSGPPGPPAPPHPSALWRSDARAHGGSEAGVLTCTAESCWHGSLGTAALMLSKNDHDEMTIVNACTEHNCALGTL